MFGEENFVEELIWSYGSPSGGRAATPKPVNIHDYILHYASDYNNRKQNRVYVPYSQKYINDWFKYTDEDGFELDDGSQMLIVPDTSPLGRILQVKLPHRLQIEEGTTLVYEKTLFYNALSDCIKKGKLKENKKIRFYVSDSTTKKHYVLTNKTATELLSDMLPKKDN